MVELTFTHMNIEPGLTDCEYDNVTVYNGPSAASTVLGTYCGISAPLPIISTSSRITLIFQSDNDITFSGFMASYAAVDTSAIDSGSQGRHHAVWFDG